MLRRLLESYRYWRVLCRLSRYPPEVQRMLIEYDARKRRERLLVPGSAADHGLQADRKA